MEPDIEVGMEEPRGKKRPIGEPQASHKPRKIRALDPDVVNKIAAGEIIVAPMHALKELIENAVDAGSTSLEILVKEGGLKLLQITDNGHGIDREDLPILCERFTTSKLKEFEDLSSIGTYGFRGEALASISHIAHLTVTTKTADSSCAWRAHYSDGKLVAPKPGQSAEPKATAGRGGTQITVEDLFYNVTTRRRAFRSASEEYAKVLDVVGRYAVHCSGVAFSCRKHGDAGVSIATAAASNTIDRIRQIHGSAVANELVEFSVKDEKLGFSASGLATNANYHVKRTTILLFINHRSVESTAIKRAVEQTYSTFLPKGGHPFVYLDIEIEPHRLDVNVHPTKREVNFLNEDEITETVCDEIRSKLAQVDSSRTFLTQTLLPSVRTLAPSNRDSEVGPSAPKTPATTKKPHENNLVRTDSRVRKITSMLTPTVHRTSTTATDIEATAQATQTVLDEGFHYETTDREPNKIPLTSVKMLRATVRNSMHSTLTETIASHTYVGLADEQRRIAAIQSGVKLYLIDYGMFCSEFFYQIGLTDFGNFGKIKLDPAPKLVDIIRIAADAEVEGMQTRADEAAAEEREIFAKAPETVAQTLIDRKEMLSEYFAIEISDGGHLLTLPLLLKGYLPSLGKLPRFLLRLGPYVNWEDEQECFRTFLRELAAFYTPEQLPRPRLTENGGSSASQGVEGQGVDEEEDGEGEGEGEDEYMQTRRAQMARMLEHVVFPALRARLVATTGLLKGVVEVADLKGLYRVFERC